MKNTLIVLLIFFGSNGFISAKENFLFTNISENFDIRVEVEKCEDQTCEGEAVFYILKKNQSKIIQTIKISETYLNIGGKQKRKGNLTIISGSEIGGVSFADYNFDGIKDLIIGNGNYAPYGGISYDYFLFNKSSGRFVFHKQLTETAGENMFLKVNPKQKYLETFVKNGCCLHQTARYKFARKRLQKIYVFTEDAISRTDGKMKIITEKLIRGKWRMTTKIVSRNEYYKDN